MAPLALFMLMGEVWLGARYPKSGCTYVDLI